jgi:glutathione S-transferase
LLILRFFLGQGIGKNQGIDIDAYPHFKRWFEMIGERPAVKRGCESINPRMQRKPLHDDKAREQPIWFNPVSTKEIR